jgi:hypothetical protein
MVGAGFESLNRWQVSAPGACPVDRRRGSALCQRFVRPGARSAEENRAPTPKLKTSLRRAVCQAGGFRITGFDLDDRAMP